MNTFSTFRSSGTYGAQIWLAEQIDMTRGHLTLTLSSRKKSMNECCVSFGDGSIGILVLLHRMKTRKQKPNCHYESKVMQWFSPQLHNLSSCESMKKKTFHRNVLICYCNRTVWNISDVFVILKGQHKSSIKYVYQFNMVLIVSIASTTLFCHICVLT